MSEYVQRGKTPRTIKGILRKKVDEWIKSIKDPEVAKAAKKDTIVTGGAIASMLTGDPVNDFDIYFTTRDTTEKIARYYLAEYTRLHPDKLPVGSEVKVDEETGRVTIHIPSQGVAGEQGEDEGAGRQDTAPPDSGECERDDEGNALLETLPEVGEYRPVFLSSNAITLTDKIQLIIRFYGDVEEIHKNYDFVHCTNAWTSDDSKLHIRSAALLALMSKKLIYVGSRYPVCSLIRTRKFIKRGYNIDAGQYVKMCMQVSKLDLTNPTVLEDQLVGVDAAFFLHVIRICKDKVDKDGAMPVSYVLEVLDRIFGMGEFESEG